MWPCATEKRETANVAALSELPTAQCFKMEPERRWAGIWQVSEHEGFCPNVGTNQLSHLPKCDGGLDVRYPEIRKILGEGPSVQLDSGLYAIEFLGRRTKYEGAYGGLPVFSRLYVVDKVLALRKVAEVAASERPGDGTLK
jgi:hypothetical protein